MMQENLRVYKQVGETPLEALERSRIEYEIASDVPMTYAGRLDPMAEGLLLILVGDECKNKGTYLGLDKEYEVEVLFGFGTDTGDLLGKVLVQDDKAEIQEEKVKKALGKFVGKFTQEYPAFSSKTVEGKPLFARAKSGELPDEMPTKDVEIYTIGLLGERTLSSTELFDYIRTNIAKVSGDFRQTETLLRWKEILEKSHPQSLEAPANGGQAIYNFQLVKIKVHCSSGTYMRSLAQRLGKELELSALAFSIRRTRIGDFVI